MARLSKGSSRDGATRPGTNVVERRLCKYGLCGGVGLKARVILEAVNDGCHSVPAIAARTDLPQTTVLRVAALLCETGLIGRLPDSGRFELLPVFQRSGPDE